MSTAAEECTNLLLIVDEAANLSRGAAAGGWNDASRAVERRKLRGRKSGAAALESAIEAGALGFGGWVPAILVGGCKAVGG